jgi:hypothetical protein
VVSLLVKVSFFAVQGGVSSNLRWVSSDMKAASSASDGGYRGCSRTARG